MNDSKRHHRDALPPFTLLMSVYAGNTMRELERAVESGTIEQKLPPNQLVIVRDGPVSDDIQRYLESLPSTMAVWFAVEHPLMEPPEVTVVPLEENHGLAHALNVGLEYCRYDIVARADCDDVSLPNRFSTIIPQFVAPARPAGHARTDGATSVDVVGSAIREFSGDEGHPGQIRLLPAEGRELEKYARMQSPIHHPSVVFRKAAVVDAGGYPENNGRFEDYLLWERLMLNGAGFLNVPEPLVLYRTNQEAYERRGGWGMFRDELRLQWQFLRDGFTNPVEFLRNLTVRAIYRLTPTWIRQRVYRSVVSRHNSAFESEQQAAAAAQQAPRGRHRTVSSTPVPARRATLIDAFVPYTVQEPAGSMPNDAPTMAIRITPPHADEPPAPPAVG